MTRRTRSPEETKALAADLATRIIKKGPAARGATVVALYGRLGAGKTTFVQGFYKGLGIKKVPASPTFILMRRTRIVRHSSSQRAKAGLRTRATAGKARFKNIFHIDAYRLRSGTDDHLGLRELFADPANLFLVEWPEHLASFLPRSVLRIRFSHGKTSEERRITFPS